MADAATRWAAELEAWAVPAHILEAAPQTPWVFPPDMFSAPEPGSVPRSGQPRSQPRPSPTAAPSWTSAAAAPPPIAAPERGRKVTRVLR